MHCASCVYPLPDRPVFLSVKQPGEYRRERIPYINHVQAATTCFAAASASNGECEARIFIYHNVMRGLRYRRRWHLRNRLQVPQCSRVGAGDQILALHVVLRHQQR